MMDAMINLAHHSEAVGNIFNIGSTEAININDLALRIKEKTNSDSPIKFVPYDEAYEQGFEDMTVRVPDLTKIKALIGYQPSINLNGILDNVIEYFSTDRLKF